MSKTKRNLKDEHDRTWRTKGHSHVSKKHRADEITSKELEKEMRQWADPYYDTHIMATFGELEDG